MKPWCRSLKPMVAGSMFVFWPPCGLSAVVPSSRPARAGLRGPPASASSLHAPAGPRLRPAAATIPGGNPGTAIGLMSPPVGIRREDSFCLGSFFQTQPLRNFEALLPGFSWRWHGGTSDRPALAHSFPGRTLAPATGNYRTPTPITDGLHPCIRNGTGRGSERKDHRSAAAATRHVRGRTRQEKTTCSR